MHAATMSRVFGRVSTISCWRYCILFSLCCSGSVPLFVVVSATPELPSLLEAKIHINRHDHLPNPNANASGEGELVVDEIEEFRTERIEVDVDINGGEDDWEDPLPPQNLRLKMNEEGVPVAIFNWETPSLIHGPNVRLTGFKVTLEPLPLDGYDDLAHHREEVHEGRPTSFLVDDTHFTTDKVYSLERGRSYSLSIQTEFHAHLSQPITTNFTIRPNPPDRFVVWYRNETCFLVLWQPPTHGVFQRYKAELSPRESPISTLFVPRWDYQYGGVRPGFFSLTPGKAYNISVVTESGDGVESSPISKEYRTMPLPVANVTLSILNFKGDTRKVLVEWEPPSLLEGEHDGFNVYIKRDEWAKPVQKFVSKNKPPRAHLDDSDLVLGEEYEVIVKTVSGKVSSHPTSSTFTYFLPVILPQQEPESDRNYFEN